MEQMRILVCGSRTWTNENAVRLALQEYRDFQKEFGREIVIIDGAQRSTDQDGKHYGADFIANKIAVLFGFKCERYPADWDKYGKSAGPIRNQQMIDEGKPNLVLAFWDGTSSGTKDMIKRAKLANIPVQVYTGPYAIPEPKRG